MSARVQKAHSHSKQKVDDSPYLFSINIQLDQQINQLFSDHNETSNLTSSYQRLYRNVEFLCRYKYQSAITTEIYSKIEKFEDVLIQEFIDNHDDSNPLQLLKDFITLFDVIGFKAKITERIYLYLDRSYLLNHPSKSTIADFFKDYLYLKLFDVHSEIGRLLIDSALDILNESRDSEDPSIEDVIIKTLKRLNLLLKQSDQLDTKILDSTKSFLKNKKKQMMETVKADEVFEEFYLFISKEIDFWEKCEITKELRSKLKSLNISELLFNDFENTASALIMPILESNKFLILGQFFRCMQYYKVTEEDKFLKKFGAVWYQYVINYTNQIFIDKEQDLIESLVTAKKQIHIVVRRFLDNNSFLEFRTREAFQAALEGSINSASQNINEKLLKYLDSFFKSAPGELESENNATLEDAFTIFKSIKSKEQFTKNYQRLLSRRLIMSLSKDILLEKNFLQLIESEVGIEDVKPLFTMIQDIESSKKYEEEFRPRTNIEFTPMILNSKAWPPSRATCVLQTELSDILSEFQALYLSGKTEKLKLQWSPVLSYMSISGQFKNATKELQVSTPQGVVLLLFNDFSELSYAELKEKSGLDSKTLSSVLYSLTMGRYKILLKSTSGEKTSYTINEDFQDKKKVIKIKQIQMKLKNSNEDDDEMEDIEDAYINYDKDDSIKAFIVSTMKRVKQIKHVFLVEKVMEKYLVDQSDIKRNIDQLITQDYIKRSAQLDVYEYIS